MRTSRTADLWWKQAVIYCLDVQTFLDSDGDGIGDFRGLTERVDYLVDLGVDVVWLMPFYPTADVDDGYDITDYYAVDPRLGTLGDVVDFIRTAGDRGLRVIADLVVNHTSAEHPWFQSARSAPDSPYREWYVWRDEPGQEKPGDVVFPDRETSTWTYDEQAGQYYLHRFYRSQPDLNVTNPVVRDEIARIMGFWMQLGLAGFRVDAVPFLLETSGVDGGVEALPAPHAYLRDLRAFLDRRRGDAVLLGEVNLAHEQARVFFGDEDGDELTMLFDFPTMQATYLALARGDAGPVRMALMGRPDTPADSQWAVFARNHDELTLDKLSGAERQEVFAAFGPEKRMQLYGRGLRRRLPPMLDGDQLRIRLAYSLMLSLPGTPTLFYGEEIGLGEQLELDGRLAVRTPMQWKHGPLGGFTTATDPAVLCRPFPDGAYGPDAVNVARQRHDPQSLLSWWRERLRVYRECPEVAWGSATVLEHPVASVLAHRSDWQGGTLVLLHNLAPQDVTVALSLPEEPAGTYLVDIFDPDLVVEVGDGGGFTVDLEAYGARWFRVLREGDAPLL
jgi:maltose alpha-D-glucosyltransferase/alpha-amylase